MNLSKMMKEIYMESNKDPKENKMDAIWNKIINFIGFDITSEKRKCGVITLGLEQRSPNGMVLKKPMEYRIFRASDGIWIETLYLNLMKVDEVREVRFGKIEVMLLEGKEAKFPSKYLKMYIVNPNDNDMEWFVTMEGVGKGKVKRDFLTKHYDGDYTVEEIDDTIDEWVRNDEKYHCRIRLSQRGVVGSQTIKVSEDLVRQMEMFFYSKQ